MLQFSNDCRTEVELSEDAAPLDAGAFEKAVGAIQRIGGGTNVLAPMRCARSAERHAHKYAPGACVRCARADA